MDSLDFLKTVLDPQRLAVVGLVAVRACTIKALADETGQRPRDVLATLGPLVHAGIVERDGEHYRLRPDALRELARDLPQPQPTDRRLFHGMTAAEQQVLARFFRGERLVELPSQQRKRHVVLERIALDFEPGVRYPEGEVNERLQRYHDDYAALRRYLVDEGMLDRAGAGTGAPAAVWSDPARGIDADMTDDANQTGTERAAGFAEDNVIASFADMDAARGAIGALEDQGIDAARISLLGQQGREAAEDPDTVGRDERVMDQQAKTAATGVVVGAGVGGTVGFLAGVAAFGFPGVGPVVAGGIWAMALGGAAAGSGVGLAANAYAKIKQSEAWEASYDTVSAGRVIVGVHAPDEAELRRAAKVLADHGGSDLSYFDREGRRREHP